MPASSRIARAIGFLKRESFDQLNNTSDWRLTHVGRGTNEVDDHEEKRKIVQLGPPSCWHDSQQPAVGLSHCLIVMCSAEGRTDHLLVRCARRALYSRSRSCARQLEPMLRLLNESARKASWTAGLLAVELTAERLGRTGITVISRVYRVDAWRATMRFHCC